MQLKVLLVEDHQSASISVEKTLNDMKIENIQNISYCDDAIIYFKKALDNSSPYDLVITDLNFVEDHKEQQIKNGQELIRQLRSLYPPIKIIVFSAENNPLVIKKLYDELEIDGFVGKSRGDSVEMRKALEQVIEGKKYTNQKYLVQIRDHAVFSFTDYDVMILTKMVEGKRQDEIAKYFKENSIQPSALSSIEKRLRHIKTSLQFQTNEQMIAYCVRMGIV